MAVRQFASNQCTTRSERCLAHSRHFVVKGLNDHLEDLSLRLRGQHCEGCAAEVMQHLASRTSATRSDCTSNIRTSTAPFTPAPFTPAQHQSHRHSTNHTSTVHQHSYISTAPFTPAHLDHKHQSTSMHWLHLYRRSPYGSVRVIIELELCNSGMHDTLYHQRAVPRGQARGRWVLEYIRAAGNQSARELHECVSYLPRPCQQQLTWQAAPDHLVQLQTTWHSPTTAASLQSQLQNKFQRLLPLLGARQCALCVALRN